MHTIIAHICLSQLVRVTCVLPIDRPLAEALIVVVPVPPFPASVTIAFPVESVVTMTVLPLWVW